MVVVHWPNAENKLYNHKGKCLTALLKTDQNVAFYCSLIKSDFYAINNVIIAAGSK